MKAEVATTEPPCCPRRAHRGARGVLVFGGKGCENLRTSEGKVVRLSSVKMIEFVRHRVVELSGTGGSITDSEWHGASPEAQPS